MSPRPRVLVVGVGSIGERHTRCFQATGRVELAICEVQPALRDTIAQRYGLTHVHADLGSALADAPQAVVIATPAPFH
ncbi:MAG: Gfo/Idh/MocA family oxidoreductase, partial [Pirellulaceae bacterium]